VTGVEDSRHGKRPQSLRHGEANPAQSNNAYSSVGETTAAHPQWTPRTPLTGLDGSHGCQNNQHSATQLRLNNNSNTFHSYNNKISLNHFYQCKLMAFQCFDAVG